MENRLHLKLVNLDSVDSTNGYCHELAKKGAREITIVRAKGQTKGRGRMGRTWISPKNKGIYFSLILTPPNPLEDLYYLPVIFSLAVARALGHILALRIKLPNDVVSGNRKICGILVEAKVAKKKADFVIAGIGININTGKEELPPKASSLYLETGIKYNIEDLFRKVVKEVISIYKEFQKRNIKELLREAFLYQDIKKIKELSAPAINNSGLRESVHLL